MHPVPHHLAPFYASGPKLQIGCVLGHAGPNTIPRGLVEDFNLVAIFTPPLSKYSIGYLQSLGPAIEQGRGI